LADPVHQHPVGAGEPLGRATDLGDLRLDARDLVAALDERRGHRLLPPHEDADSLRHVSSALADCRLAGAADRLPPGWRSWPAGRRLAAGGYSRFTRLSAVPTKTVAQPTPAPPAKISLTEGAPWVEWRASPPRAGSSAAERRPYK